MFLLVLAISFLTAQMMVRNWKSVGDEEDALVDFDDCQDNNEIVTAEVKAEDPDIFFICDTDSVRDVKTKYSSQARNEEKESWMERLGLKDSVSDKRC